jgi:DNA-binding PadR family transcriptional regulator
MSLKTKKRKAVDPRTLLPLPNAVLHLLLGVAEGERHGYALKREIATRTGGQVILGPGALYGSIQKMLSWGLIEESEDRPESHLDDQRRRYYRITPAGQQVLEAELDRMQAILAAAKNKLPRPVLEEAR